MLLRKTVKIYWRIYLHKQERLIFKYQGEYYMLISHGMFGNKRKKFSSTALISRNDNNIEILCVSEFYLRTVKEISLPVDVRVKDLQKVLSFYERTELNINDLEDAILD